MRNLDPVTRRRFLRYMGASLLLAGAGGCTRQPEELILPYGSAPETRIPGRPHYFATAMPLTGGAFPILVESHMGRPTKVEGNPDHPASLGGTHALAQGSVLGLYDPDRSQVTKCAGRIRSWSAFLAELRAKLDPLIAKDGKGLRILTESSTSPTLTDQIWNLKGTLPELGWHQFEPVDRDAARAGFQLAFGEDADPVFRIGKADVILALDADFLARGPGCVRYSRDFAARRDASALPNRMSRLYVVETTPSLTGAKADHRLRVRPAAVEGIARAVAAGLGLKLAATKAQGRVKGAEHWVRAVVADLKSHKGACLVLAGEEQPPAVHAIAHALNLRLGNAGNTVDYIEPLELEPVFKRESLAKLAADMEAGEVQALVILEGNPVFTAPAELDFARKLAKVDFTVRLGLYEDETSAHCRWHIPQAHFLESWSDAVTYDGTTTILQPLIAPLYEGRSAHELVSILGGQVGRSSHDIVRSYWEDNNDADDFEAFWRQSLRDGLVPDTTAEPKEVTLQENWAAGLEEQGARAPRGNGMDLLLRPDPTIWDGRFANNGWLQELPKPLTQLTWDNAALLAPHTARRLGLENGRVVELRLHDRSLRAPVWILPGQAEECVTLHFGYGRTRAGRVGSGTGSDAFRLRFGDSPWHASGVVLKRTGETRRLACVQEHALMEGRAPARGMTVREFGAPETGDCAASAEREEEHATLTPPVAYPGPAWGMVIDLARCTGCSACVIACQAENNIPVVGKTEIALGRRMHWIRVDRYFEGEGEKTRIHHQPIPCMQCENAPCEVVCPVGATVHSAEGLNDMVYNRCVGTRYCANNCPYKVRRFNFYQYAEENSEVRKLGRNPDVTVRTRGVMEKCTYCVQRINEARIRARKEDRPIREGEIVTACQGACPAGAILFGDLAAKKSRIAALRRAPHNYALLEELGIRPRTTYLSAIRNPNPALEAD